MMTAVTIVVCLVMLSLVRAGYNPLHHVVHERREVTHPRWTRRGRIPDGKYLPMRIGLTQTNLDTVYSHLMSVSHPDSPRYGHHWTQDQVTEAFKPSDETHTTVKQWLTDNGIADRRIALSENKAWFVFHATSEEAERLMRTEFYEYHDSVSGVTLPACDQYHLPKHLSGHIDYISPGIKLQAPAESIRVKRDAVTWSTKTHSGSRIAHDLLRQPAVGSILDVNDLSNCDHVITPACVAALYKIPPSGGKPHPDNSLGIFESELQFWTQLDLDSFFTNFTQGRIPNGTHPVAANIDGGQQSTEDPYSAGVEVNLDLMLAYPIVYPQTITNYQVDDFVVQANPNDTYTSGFNTFLDALDGSYCTFSAYNLTGNDPSLDPKYPNPAIGGWRGNLECGTRIPAKVISLSYGGQEADLPLSYQKRQCLEYAKLGMQGVSFLFASGDAGVSDYPSPAGIDGPTGCLGPNLDIFNPTWPVNCPFVTSVGGTKLYPGSSIHDNESAVYDPVGSGYSVNFSSGGGFSNVYGVPDYQKDAIANYFKYHDPGYPHYSALSSDTQNIRLYPNVTQLAGDGGGVYNRIGRGIPDVAAVADNIAIYIGGNFSLSGGTSASTPIFAAIINRINEERLRTNKSVLGFLNPAMYKNPSMFHDIVNGSNPGCNTTGFSAVPGWDPVTGLGTPDYPKMLEYFMSLPGGPVSLATGPIIPVPWIVLLVVLLVVRI